ncbi:MAG TPA: tRNA (adenosine(37)-N6)-threonylcarbamoyltransferase complex dimerization subunit type 1 TsaB [Gammaproteobacteria bacterium]
MKLLAIELSSAVGSVALAVDGRVTERAIHSPRAQQSLVLPLVDELLGETGLELAGLDGVAFGRGPGSFTGLRIAAAVAQGFGLAAALPLLPVSSLAALAQRAWREGGAEAALTCVDAHMGEVYWAAYAIEDGVAVLRGEERLGPPASVEPPADGAWHAVGDGFAAHAEALAAVAARAARVRPDLLPAARDLLPQAERDLAAGRHTPPEEALPVYLRGAGAWGKRGG